MRYIFITDPLHFCAQNSDSWSQQQSVTYFVRTLQIHDSSTLIAPPSPSHPKKNAYLSPVLPVSTVILDPTPLTPKLSL